MAPPRRTIATKRVAGLLVAGLLTVVGALSCESDHGVGQPTWTITDASPLGRTAIAYGVTVAEDDSVYMTGAITIEGSSPDVIVRRLARDGATMWTRFHDGHQGVDVGHALVVDARGDIVVVGASPECHRNTADVWIHRFGGDGEPGWTEWMHGALDTTSSARGLAWLPGGDLVVVGTLTDSQTGQPGIFVQRMTPDGEPLDLFTTHGLESDAIAEAVAVSGGDRVIVGGALTDDGGDRLWVGAFTPELDLVWSHSEEPGHAHGVASLPDGAVIIGGVTGQGHSLIRRLDPDSGETLWTTGDKWTRVSAVAAAGGGEFVVAGESRIRETPEVWIARFADDGTLLDETHELIADGMGSRAFAVAVTPDQAIIVAGDAHDIEAKPTLWVQRRDP